MRTPRCFCAALNETAQTLSLDAQAHHHLSHVLRLHVGDPIHLFNGRGLEAIAVIEAIRKKNTTVRITTFAACDNQSPCRLTLVQALTRSEKMDLILQKATELGIDTIAPVRTAYCQIKLTPEKQTKKMAHWQKILESAAEQSERSHLPSLLPITTLTEWLDQHAATTLFALHPRQTQTQPLPDTLTDAALLVGPEGGFSEHEVQQLDAQKAHFYQLGPRILRTETAGLAMISILQARYGDYGYKTNQ